MLSPLSSALTRKHYKVIQSYYLRYMSGFDAAYMRDVVMVSKPGNQNLAVHGTFPSNKHQCFSTC